jgi:hypothetical protein
MGLKYHKQFLSNYMLSSLYLQPNPYIMKTNQIMKRQFDNAEVSQRTKDSFFNATELLKHYNSVSGKQKVLAEFWSNKNTAEFIEALENELVTHNVGIPLHLKTYETTRGKGGATWMHPYLFVKFAMWLSPELEVRIIKWVYDNLIEYRNQAGDYYKEMCEAIALKYKDFYSTAPDPLVFVKEAQFLNKLVFGRAEANQRNEATAEELSLMNQLQLANIKMINQGVSKIERHRNLQMFSELYSAGVK